jgi:HlyD family secretion protein
MRKQFLRTLVISGIATGLIACGNASAPTAQPTAAGAVAAVATATVQPTVDLGSLVATPAQSDSSSMTTMLVSGTGEVKTLNDAELNFQVTGTVSEISAREGATVKAGDLIATLDTTLYDQQIAQANANLASPDDLFAQAQLKQALAAQETTKPGSTSADARAATLSLEVAQSNLKSTKDRLSLAKTQSQLQLDIANQTLTQATSQLTYDQWNWEWVVNEGTDPVQPTMMGRPNKIGDSTIKRYKMAYEISVSRRDAAQIGLRNAQIGYDQAVQGELVGNNTAQQQLQQAQLAYDRVVNPTGRDLANIEATVASAQAAVNRITAARAQAEAGVAQAEAALTLATINRSRAEIRAPFAGTIAYITIAVGDPANPAGRPVVQLVDTANLRIDALISDADIGNVTVGQRVTVSVDAVPGQTYEGTVAFVSPIAVGVGNVRSYTIHVDLSDTTNLRAGMSARVNLLGE